MPQNYTEAIVFESQSKGVWKAKSRWFGTYSVANTLVIFGAFAGDFYLQRQIEIVKNLAKRLL